MPLSAKQVQSSESKSKPYKLSDGTGLYLLVKSSDSKLWRYDYRFDGKRKTKSYGAYPAVSLAVARKKHETAKQQLADGIDPMAAEQAEFGGLENNRFETVGRAWLEARRPGWDGRYADRVLARIEVNLFARFGDKPISAVSVDDILGALHPMAARGAIEAAHIVKRYADGIFKFAKGLQLIDTNPVPDITDAKLLPSKPKTRRRAFIAPPAMPTFMSRFAVADEEQDTRDALLLTIYCATRTVETRFITGAELENMDRPGEELWRLPSERMPKTHLEHQVPLPRQAVEIVRRRLAKHGAGLLFPRKTVSGVLSENTMLYAMYRMGYHGQATVHGFRTTFSTLLNEQTRFDELSQMPVRLFPEDWIERQLSHVDPNEVRGAYNAAEWIGPRRAMLQWWADWVDRQGVIGRLVG